MTAIFSSSKGSFNSLLTFRIAYLLRQLKSSEAVGKLDSEGTEETYMIAESQIYFQARAVIIFALSFTK